MNKPPFHSNGSTGFIDPDTGRRVCTGSMMGRGSVAASPEPGQDNTVKLHLVRVRLDAGGYEKGGAYWGRGLPLYCAYDDTHSTVHYIRAMTRNGAKLDLAASKGFPAGASFYR